MCSIFGTCSSRTGGGGCLFMDPNNLLTIFLFFVVYRELGSRFRATPGYTSPVGIFLCLETPARPGRTTSCKFG